MDYGLSVAHRIHHQNSCYIFYLFYKWKAHKQRIIWILYLRRLCRQNLIIKWKKQVYENLCYLRCIQTPDTNLGINCICQVLKARWKRAASLSARTVTARAAVLRLWDLTTFHAGLDFTGFCLSRHPLYWEQLFSQSGAPDWSCSMVSMC